jgi:hypothetical protein
MTKTIWHSSAIFLLAAAVAMAAAPAFAQQKKPAKPAPNEQAVLLGQFGDWGAYTASPGGKKVCFALSKPTSAVTEPAGRNRDPSYAFVSTRPAEKVKNEISVIVGFPQKPGVDASAAIGSTNFMMYTQNDGAWIKNAAEEAQMIDAMWSRACPRTAPRPRTPIRSRVSPMRSTRWRRSVNSTQASILVVRSVARLEP